MADAKSDLDSDSDSDYSYANQWNNSWHDFSRLEPEAFIFNLDALLMDSPSRAFRGLKEQPAAM